MIRTVLLVVASIRTASPLRVGVLALLLVVPLLAVLLLAAAGILVCSAPEQALAGENRRVAVPKHLIHFDDGDTLTIRWTKGEEQVRILGIDTPEVMHLEHDLPYAQPFGNAAAGFLRGCLAVANKVELLRSAETDRYDRTLGYLFVNGLNYSVLTIRAQLAAGPSGRFGDNGLPDPFAACRAAARAAGPLPFEAPYRYRKRMRTLSAWMKKNGVYPHGPSEGR